MSHSMACGDKACTRLKDLLDRTFLEAKARESKQLSVPEHAGVTSLEGKNPQAKDSRG